MAAILLLIVVAQLLLLNLRVGKLERECIRVQNNAVVMP